MAAKVYPLPKLYHPDFAFNVKPKGPVEIDWNDPITNELVSLGYVSGGVAVDLVSGAKLPTYIDQTVTPTVYKGESALQGTAAAGFAWDLPRVIDSPSRTLVARFLLTQTAGTDRLLHLGNNIGSCF